MSEEDRNNGLDNFFVEPSNEEEATDLFAPVGETQAPQGYIPPAAPPVQQYAAPSAASAQGAVPVITETAPVPEDSVEKTGKAKRKKSGRSAIKSKAAKGKAALEEGIRKGTRQAEMLKKEIEEDDRELKEPSSKNRQTFFTLALALLVVVTIVFLFSDRFYNRLRGRSSYVLDDIGVSIPYTEGNTTLLTHKENLIRCSQDGLMAINEKGGVIYDVPYTMSAPYPAVGGDYISVADRLGMSLMVIKDGQTKMSVTTESVIILNTVNATGESCVVLNAANGHMIVLYDINGNILMQRRTYSASDGIPMGLALSDDGSRMATVYVNYTGTELASIVTLFDLTESGSVLVDRIVGSMSFSQCLISDICFVGNELFYAGTDRIGALSAEGSVKSIWEQQLSYELKSLCLGNEFFAVLYGNGQAGTALPAENNIVVYNYNGDTLYEMNVEDAGYIDVWGDTVIYAKGRIYYGISSVGKAMWTMNTGDTYGRLVAYNNDKTVAATRNGELRVYKVSLRSVESEHVD
ncbi:MAG: hypothetical protein HUJ69_02265 [Lachnospiraceae bacterium]|nr:hypothetical protein [Lachnospiraceae bacterium]